MKNKPPTHGYVKLFTLGKTFTWGDLFDRIKKYFMEFLGIFIVITFSFYVESKGEAYETRMTYADLLKDIVQELHAVQQYTDQYLIHNEQIKQIYRQQLRRWDVDPDPLFILAPEDSLYDLKHAIPMATYTEITDFDEPQLLFTLFEQGDLDFKLVSKATQIIEALDQGRLIDQMLLLNQQERLLVADFKQRIKNQWTQDLGILTLKNSAFWIKNRSYIQNDHYLRHNLSERVALWDTFGSLLEAYQNELTLDIARLDRINHGFMKERYLIYWRYK